LYKDAIVAFKYDELRSALNRKFGAAPYTIVWEHVLPCEVHTSFAASDLNNDNYPEIAFGCDDGNLYVLDKDGKLVFNFKTKDKVRSTPAIADIDFDGKPEIIFGSDDGNLYVLSNEGKLKWSFKTKDKIESSPTIFVENKTVLIAFGSDDGNLYLIGRYFQELEFYCSYKAMGKIRSSPIIYSKRANYPQVLPIFKKEYTKKVRDNVNEYLKNGRIVFGSDDGNVYILNFNCELIKEYKTGGRIRSSPAMLKDMMAIGSEDGNLYFF
jgi:outer membrane protein assembly factor BamB